MNKAELIKAVANKGIKFPQSVVANVLDQLAQVVTETLDSDQEVPLPGIGKLTTKPRPARTARNPRTGESVAMAADRVVKFRVAPDLKATIK